MYRYVSPETPMPSYLIFPRKLLKLGLTVTELSVYMLLLDRARLSCQNEGWQDAEGHTFLLFPVRALAEALDSSETAVKKALRKLEEKGLITRRRQGMCRPNRIYVKVPEADEAPSAGDGRAVSPPGNEAASPEVNEAASPVGSKTASPRARKLPPNKNYKEKTKEQSAASGPTLAEYNRMQRFLKRLEGTAEEGRQAPPPTKQSPGPSPGPPPSYP